jgi:PIN domain nuclease of toxin-antitoxin system
MVFGMADETVTVSEAKTQLSQLIQRAANGEEIVIRRLSGAAGASQAWGFAWADLDERRFRRAGRGDRAPVRNARLSALLLDSHALLWWEADDARLSDRARERIERPASTAFFSAVSLWELAIKQALGKLRLPDSLISRLIEEGFREVPVTAAHGLLAGHLPRHHNDPFDRMLVAQASSEGFVIVTADPRIVAYNVPVLW